MSDTPATSAELSGSEKLNVSYSKAQAFRTCKYKYDLAFVRPHPTKGGKGLMPHEKSHALTRGTFGHGILERFFKRVQGTPYPYSQSTCKEIIDQELALAITENAALAQEVLPQIVHFAVNVFPAKGWKILEVEKTFRLPIGKRNGVEVTVPVTIDLVAQEADKIIVVDHKFSADAYSEERCAIEPQIPIYMGALRALKIPVHHGYYNFLRTRKMKNVPDQVVQVKVTPNNFRVMESFQEHIQTVDDIIDFTGNPPKRIVRTPNNNCQYCDFKLVCGVEMRGDDASLMLETRFDINDYGYDELT